MSQERKKGAIILKDGEKMNKVKIPNYNLCEELINSISHGAGTLLGIVALVLTIIFSHSAIGVVSSCIYGVTMIIMYTNSTLYHALSPKLKAKKVFRILDHSSIYLFIAGCYTPYALCVLKGAYGWTLFGIIWGLALIGIILNSINIDKFQVITNILYLVMGWLIILSFNRLSSLLSSTCLYLLLIGGIVYTIGAILYGIGSKKRYFHSVFHFFVLAGSILQFFSILYTV